jgi:hypothetical protein
MPRKHKKHHKVPATYLHGFTDDDGKLWIVNRDFKIYSGKPESVLSESDYYTIHFPSGGGTLTIETEYLKSIEGTYATLYREKIKNRKRIDLETKAKLSIFVASMLERQTSMRKSLQNFFNDAQEKIDHLRSLPKEAKRKLASTPSFTRGKGIPADDFLKLGKDVRFLHSSMIPERVDFLAPIIFKMKWAFIVIMVVYL